MMKKYILFITGIAFLLTIQGCGEKPVELTAYQKKVNETASNVQKHINERGATFQVVAEEMIRLAASNQEPQYVDVEKSSAVLGMLEDIAKEKKTTVLQYKMRKKTEVCEELLEENYDEMCKVQFEGVYKKYRGTVYKTLYAKDGSAGFRMYLFDMEKESNTKKALDFNKAHGTTKVEDPGKVDYIVTTQNGAKYALYYSDNYDVEVEGETHEQFVSDVFKKLDLPKE